MKKILLSKTKKNLSFGNKLVAITLFIAVSFLVSCQNEKPEPAKLSSLTTTAISNITSSSAIGGGNILNDGGAAITARGIVWGTNSSPTVALTTKTVDGTGTGSFTSNISGLTPATKYNLRAYATNSVGTTYGDEATFTTLANLPTLTAIAISNITSISANSGGNISNDGGAAVTARGIVWGTNPSPTIALTTKTTNGIGIGSFTSNISGLTPATKYYVRTYASNSAGTAYSDEVSFTSASDITITAPPSFLGLNPFYQKYLNAFGIPVVSSNKVPDAAVLQAKRIVEQMLAKMPNSALEKMVQNKMLVAIMAKDEVTTDIPEHSDLYKVFPGTDWDKRARGLSATIQRPATSCAEENLLCYPTDGYFGEDILIHEFAHTIHLIGLNLAFPTFDNELKNIYNEAIAKGLWANTYAASNHIEYFAEGVQNWFNVNKEAIPTNGIHNNINTREELKTYDPKLYELISRYFNEDSKKVSCQVGK